MELIYGNLSRERKFISYALGITSTMPIVGIAIGGHDISFFRIIYFFVLIIAIVEVLQKRLIIKKANKKLVLWLAEGLIACITGWFFLSGSHQLWSDAARSFIPRVLTLIFFSLFWSSDPKWTKYNEFVIKGFFIGCIANCIWAILDAGGFYIFGKSINNDVFSGYISRNGIRYNMLSLVYEKSIRSGGFNSDPAQFGLIAPIVVGIGKIKKNYWMMLIAIGALLASASTTGLVASIAIIIVTLSKDSKEKKHTLRRVIIGGTSAVVLAFVIIYNRGTIASVIGNAYHSFSSRIGEVYLGNTLDENARFLYLMCLPSAIFEVVPFIFWGSGFGTASLGYSLSAHANSVIGGRVNSAYDMENTYLAYLFDTGIIGFVLFISLLACLVKSFKKRVKLKNTESDIIVYCFVLASVISFAFYHYTLFAAQMLMFTIALSVLDEEGKEYA